MAVYVLVEASDEEVAQEIVRNPQAGTTVCGVWKRPTKFCDCSRGAKAYTRGKKYGWWTCAQCHKPSEFAQSATKWELALGTNLLPAWACPMPFNKRLKGWRSPVEWSGEGLEHVSEEIYSEEI